MANREVPMLVPSRATELKDGEQITRFMVWPVDPVTLKAEPAKTVKVKSEETGKIIEKAIPSIPLFRWRHTMNLLTGFELSGTWLDLRWSMWPFWEETTDVREPGQFGDDENAEAPETYLLPVTKTTGVSDEKHNKTTTSKRSINDTDIPYRDDVFKGAFGYDKSTGKSKPLNEGNVKAIIRMFRSQGANWQVVGVQGDPKAPKRLWCPFSQGWNTKENKEIEEYEENLAIFKGWIGKVVYWEFKESDMSTVLR